MAILNHDDVHVEPRLDKVGPPAENRNRCQVPGMMQQEVDSVYRLGTSSTGQDA